MTRSESNDRGIWMRLGILLLALILLPTIAYFVLRRPPPPVVTTQAETEEEPVVRPRRVPRDEPHEGRFLSGMVVDEAGTGMGGVRVRARSTDGNYIRSVQTDETGAFYLEEVPDTAITVSAEVKDHLKSSFDETRPGDHDDIRLVMKRGEPIRGHVVDGDGKPVAQASVTCTGGSDVSAQTDEEGAFAFGTAEGCTATARHQAYGVTDAVTLTPGGKNELRLPSPGSIRGSVVDEAGGVVAGGTVIVESFRPIDKELDQLAGDSASIDDSGNFELTGLVRGTYVLKAIVPDRPATKSRTIDVGSGEATRGVRIVIERGVTVSGVVTGKGSRSPVAGAGVSLDGEPGGPSTTTDEQGRFSLPNVARGPLSLAFRHPEFKSRIVTLDTKSRSGGDIKVELNESTDGSSDTELSGIGATLGNGRNGVIIAGVMGGSPAETSGLLRGDLILAIDGVDATGFAISDCIHRIRGAEGTRVGLTVDRDGTRKDFTVTRALIQR